MTSILKKKYALLLIIILIITAWSYYPALDGPYIADDYPNLLENKNIKIQSLDWSAIKDALFSSPSSQFYRPVSSLSFALNYYFSEAPYNSPVLLEYLS